MIQQHENPVLDAWSENYQSPQRRQPPLRRLWWVTFDFRQGEAHILDDED